MSAAAAVFVDEVTADPIVVTGLGSTLVDIEFTMLPCIAWHAYTSEGTAFVQAGAQVVTGVALTFVDVDLATRACESLGAITPEGAWRVHTGAIVLARKTLFALVYVFGAIDTCVSSGAGTQVPTIYRGRVAHRPGMTRVAGACVIQVTQQSSLALCALAQEGPDPVNAGGAVEASGGRAVVDVLRAVLSRPAVDADAREPALRVRASGSVLANGGAEGALVDVFRAIRARDRRRTVAGVGVDAVHAGGTILALVVVAVVYVDLAVVTFEPSRTMAPVG